MGLGRAKGSHCYERWGCPPRTPERKRWLMSLRLFSVVKRHPGMEWPLRCFLCLAAAVITFCLLTYYQKKVVIFLYDVFIAKHTEEQVTAHTRVSVYAGHLGQRLRRYRPTWRGIRSRTSSCPFCQAVWIWIRLLIKHFLGWFSCTADTLEPKTNTGYIMSAAYKSHDICCVLKLESVCAVRTNFQTASEKKKHTGSRLLKLHGESGTFTHSSNVLQVVLENQKATALSTHSSGKRITTSQNEWITTQDIWPQRWLWPDLHI